MTIRSMHMALVPWISRSSILEAMHPGSRSSRPQGFTLVELLVGLTLIALLSIILFGGMRFGMRAWETSGERIQHTVRVELVQSLLRRLLGQARMPSNTAGRPVAPFVGQSDRVTFIAPPARKGEAEDDFVYVLGRSEADQQSHLDLTWTLLRPPSSTETKQAPETAARLMGNVASVEFAYYGAPDPNRPAKWWDNWDGAHGLPTLVRLRLTFPDRDPRRWPDLIVRLVRASG